MTWHKAKTLFENGKQMTMIEVGKDFKTLVQLKQENRKLRRLLRKVDEHFDMTYENDPTYVDVELWKKIKKEIEK